MVNFLKDMWHQIEAHPNSFVFMVFSSPIAASCQFKRVRIRPVLIKEALVFSVASFTQTQCFTVNMPPDELFKFILTTSEQYQQLVLRFVEEEIHARISGTCVSYKTTRAKQPLLQELAHNRPKNKLLPENEPSKLLQALGIQTQEGRIAKNMDDKFRQINRFLEQVLELDLGPNLHIIDFGCGKAYLTFVLTQMLEPASVVGVEARGDLVQKCQTLAEELGFHNLTFVQKRIEEYTTSQPVDLVLALHACDTATDAAIAKAVALGARALFVAPCCQHEVASQIKKEAFPLLLKHGLLKERFSALLTDALRAEYLKQMGYSVDLCEFVDPEHTPKNLLIRAKRKKNPPPPDWSAYNSLCQQYVVTIALLQK